MERIADELAGIRAALEATNASDPLAMLGAALEAGADEGAPERVKLEPKVHRLGGDNWIATVDLKAVRMPGWSIDLAPDADPNRAITVTVVRPDGLRIHLSGFTEG
jgi:hypothetical protein